MYDSAADRFTVSVLTGLDGSSELNQVTNLVVVVVIGRRSLANRW